ncbi:ribosomal protein L35 [Brucella intermedia LMG 3301]|nr:ribosomal protein L35 [Brucella intermedia LMG 3301]
MPWRFRMLFGLGQSGSENRVPVGRRYRCRLKQEALSAAGTTGTKQRSSKMPKMKTKSAAKKRFKITGTGKIKAAAAGKRHGMIKRSNKFIRDARGTMVLADADAKIVKQFLPNGL